MKSEKDNEILQEVQDEGNKFLEPTDDFSIEDHSREGIRNMILTLYREEQPENELRVGNP